MKTLLRLISLMKLRSYGVRIGQPQQQPQQGSKTRGRLNPELVRYVRFLKWNFRYFLQNGILCYPQRAEALSATTGQAFPLFFQRVALGSVTRVWPIRNGGRQSRMAIAIIPPFRGGITCREAVTDRKFQTENLYCKFREQEMERRRR